MTSNLFAALLVAVGLATASGADAVTVSATSAGAFLRLSWKTTSYVPDPLVASGVDRVSSYVVAGGPDGTSADADGGTLTLLNAAPAVVTVNVGGSFAATARALVGEGGPRGRVRFLGRALGFLVGPGIDGRVFASTFGTYACTEADPDAPGFDCAGASEADGSDDFQFTTLVLAPGEAVSYEFGTAAFASLDTTLAPVPSPAGGSLLAAALGGLALLGRPRG